MRGKSEVKNQIQEGIQDFEYKKNLRKKILFGEVMLFLIFFVIQYIRVQEFGKCMK